MIWIYYVWCSKTYSTFGGRFWFPTADVGSAGVDSRGAGLLWTEAQLESVPPGTGLLQARVQLEAASHGAGLLWTVQLESVPDGTELPQTNTLDMVPLGAIHLRVRVQLEPLPCCEPGFRPWDFILRQGRFFCREVQSSWSWLWEPVNRQQLSWSEAFTAWLPPTAREPFPLGTGRALWILVHLELVHHRTSLPRTDLLASWGDGSFRSRSDVVGSHSYDSGLHNPSSMAVPSTGMDVQYRPSDMAAQMGTSNMQQQLQDIYWIQPPQSSPLDQQFPGPQFVQ